MTMTASRPVRPVYTVAGCAVACDRPIAALAALEVPLETLRSERAPDLTVRRGSLSLPSAARSVFDGNARVGTRSCQVHSLTASGGDLLRISGAGVFAISRGQASIQASIEVDPEPGAAEDAVVEALLGPALALALARRGIFVLHASAVVLRGRGVIGFLGESGAGKSTLARLLVEAGDGVSLAADDLLAIESGGEGAAALPHFPQLKLNATAMEAIAALAPRLPLLGLYALALAPAPPSAAAEAGEPLAPGSAAAHLIGHTIAGSLFANDLLAAHLTFAAAVAGRVPLRPLTVPHHLDAGAEVLKLLLKPRAPGRAAGRRSAPGASGIMDPIMVTTATHVTVPDRVLFRDLAGEAVLLELDSGLYYGLNETGTRMWTLLVEHGRADTALQSLLAEYDVPAEHLEKELLHFIETLAARNLLHLQESP
jgi:hypothetical protein